MSNALSQITKALSAINEGQTKAQAGFELASKSLNHISEGFTRSKEGLESMKAGITTVKDTTGKYAQGSGTLDNVFYLPDGALEAYPKLKDAMDQYISPNGKGVTLDVILSIPPYTTHALDAVEEITRVTAFALKDTPLNGAELYVGGTTSAYSEMRVITTEDFVKVFFFVLLGIFIVLVLLLRSIIAPVYLIFTIILSYATTMGITYIVFQVLLGYDGLTWSVPFFSFCILVALGVDYNIFLMSRVKEEYKPGDVAGGIEKALSSTGKIITSCGIIMAGTFGALILSPVTQMVQIGFTAVVGLLLDTFIIRCLVVPAIAVKIGELNWWPGKKVKILPQDMNGQGNSLSS